MRENYCGLAILIVSVFPVLLANYDTITQLRFGTADQMTGIFTKGVWQPY